MLYNADGDLTQALTSFDYQDRHRRLGDHLGIGLDGPAGERRLRPGGGNLGLYATVGDLTLKGASVSAYNVTMSAQRDVVMQSLALTDTA